MVKVNDKKANDKFRQEILTRVMNHLQHGPDGEDTIQIATNKICFPFVNENGNDEWLTITFSVPTGSRSNEPFDGYEQADEFQEKQEKAKIREEKKEQAKQKKIEMDNKKRANAKKREEG